MDARRVRALLVLLLAVAATAAAGGALDATQAGGGSPGSGDGSGMLVGDGEGGLFADAELSDTVPVPFVDTLVAAGFALAALLTILFVIAAVYDDWRRLLDLLGSSLKVGLLLLGALVGLFLLQELLAALAGSSGGAGSPGLGGGGGGAGGESSSGTVVDLPLPVVVILGAILAVVVAAVVLGRGDESASSGETGVDAPAAPTGSVPATSAGPSRAGSPLEDVSADNEVYRAWLALADEAGATAARESPDTVARRAVDEGADEAAVHEITSLFEAVRYGPAEATPERERRAAAARDELGGEHA